MAHPSTLYRFRIDLADVDRNVFEKLDLRVAMHPSEALPYLLTRVLAFALNVDPELVFSPGGLSDPDQPAISAKDAGGGERVWIEIGNPSARKLHRAAKSSQVVKVYTYKDPDLLKKEIESNAVYNADRIEIYALDTDFLERLGSILERDNSWNILRSDDSVTVSSGEFSENIEIRRS